MTFKWSQKSCWVTGLVCLRRPIQIIVVFCSILHDHLIIFSLQLCALYYRLTVKENFHPQACSIISLLLFIIVTQFLFFSYHSLSYRATELIQSKLWHEGLLNMQLCILSFTEALPRSLPVLCGLNFSSSLALNCSSVMLTIPLSIANCTCQSVIPCAAFAIPKHM